MPRLLFLRFLGIPCYKSVNLSYLLHIPVFELLSSQVWLKSILNFKLKDLKTDSIDPSIGGRARQRAYL